MSSRRRRTQARHERNAETNDARDSAESLDSRPSRGKWLGVGIIVIALLSAIVGLRYYASISNPALRDPPEVDTSNATSAVKELIANARNELLNDRASAKRWGDYGMLLFAHQFDVDAGICFGQAAALAPDEFRWHYYRGLVLTSSDREAAIEAFQTAASISPTIGVIHTRIGEILLDKQEFDNAFVHLQEAVRLSPDEARPQLGLARLALLSGDKETALRWAEAARERAEDSRTPYELLARILSSLGKKDEAAAMANRADQLPEAPIGWNDPYAAEILALRNDSAEVVAAAHDFAGTGNIERAVGLLRQQLTQSSVEPMVPLALAQILFRARQIPEAQAVLDDASRKFPLNAEVHFQLGIVRFFGGDVISAGEQFQQAIKLKPDYAKAHYNMGHVRLKLGDEGQALSEFRAAARLAPEMADARINVAKILLKSEKNSEAVEELELVRRLSPSNKEAAQLLEKAKNHGNKP